MKVICDYNRIAFCLPTTRELENLSSREGLFSSSEVQSESLAALLLPPLPSLAPRCSSLPVPHFPS
jgi:hypothetical protein